MDEENKIPGMPGEEENNIPEETAGAAAEADPELEKLPETFKNAYDETVAEFEAREEAEEKGEDEEEEEDFGPVIQPLEDFSDEELVAHEDEMDIAEAPEVKVKKQKSKGATVALTVVLTILCIIFAVLALLAVTAKLVAGSLNPEKMQMTFVENISDYNSKIDEAEEAAAKIGAEDAEGTEYDTALSAYKSAASLCSDNTWFCNRFKRKTVCAAVNLILDNENYQEAYTFLTSNLSEDEIAKCSDSAVRNVLASAKAVAAAADKAPADILANPDAEAVCAEYNLPADVADVFKNSVDVLGKAFAEDKADPAIDGKSSVLNDYYTVYTSLVNLGADKDSFAEHICAALYDNGCLYSAISFSSILGADYKGKTDGFKTLEKCKNGIKEDYSAIYQIAEEAEKAGKTGAEAIASDDGDEAVKALIASVADLCIKGIKAENEKNLTAAANSYYSAIGTAKLFGIEDATLIYRYVRTEFDCGSIPNASSDAQTLITDDIKAAFNEEQTAGYEQMQKVFTALDSASQIFSTYYTNYYYYGQEMDTEALSEELDALITEDSNSYDKAFVDYCKYYAAISTGDEEGVKKYLAGMKENAPDLPFVYGYFEISDYVENAEMNKAVEVADKLLEINVADDYAISVKALAKRLEKDYEGAAEEAEKGLALGDTAATSCAKEAGVAYMLAGDYEKAFDRLGICYEANLSLENCDLMLILQYLAGEDSSIASELQAKADEVASTYESYSVSSFSDTLAILAGEITAESVLTSGNGTLGND